MLEQRNYFNYNENTRSMLTHDQIPRLWYPKPNY